MAKRKNTCNLGNLFSRVICLSKFKILDSLQLSDIDIIGGKIQFNNNDFKVLLDYKDLDNFPKDLVPNPLKSKSAIGCVCVTNIPNNAIIDLEKYPFISHIIVEGEKDITIEQHYNKNVDLPIVYNSKINNLTISNPIDANATIWQNSKTSINHISNEFDMKLYKNFF